MEQYTFYKRFRAEYDCEWEPEIVIGVAPDDELGLLADQALDAGWERHHDPMVAASEIESFMREDEDGLVTYMQVYYDKYNPVA